MIDWNKPIETACGNKARRVYRSPTGTLVNLMVVLAEGDQCDWCTDEGKGLDFNYRNAPPKTTTLWCNVYRFSQGQVEVYFHPTSGQAEERAVSGIEGAKALIAKAVPLTFEERSND